MKTKYIAIAVLALTTLVSCNRDEDSLFEKSAAQRAQEAITNASEALTAADNGWEFVYFCNTETRGYNLLVRLYKDGHVKFTAKNALTTNNQMKTDSASAWTLISDYGPLLSFNTYNEVFHIWSDPQNDGDGYLGDYEFLILNTTAERIKLKGKKHSGYSVLNRLPSDLSWVDYYAQVEAMDAKLFGNGNIFELHQGGNVYSLYNGAEGIFQLADQGQLPNAEDPEIYPVATTRNGIQLMKGFKGNKDNKTFTLNDGRLEFSTDEYLCIGNLANYADTYVRVLGNQWNIATSETNANTAAAVATVLGQLKALSTAAQKNASVKGLTLAYDADVAKYIVSFRYTKDKKTKEQTPLRYVFNVSVEGNALTLAYAEPADNNATMILDKVPGIVPLMQTLNGTYTIDATAEPINPTLGSKMISTTNADVWFTMTGSIPSNN